MSRPAPVPSATHRRRRRRWAALSAALGMVAAATVGVLGSPVFHAQPPPRPATLVLSPAGTSALDDGATSVAQLDPGLLSALRRAAADAARDGVGVTVMSGWRSSAEQERLFRAAVAEHGTEAEAARWVARPGTSPHEAGEAVDLGPWAATAWLARHGAGYGLCQIYRNEPWHYELRPKAVDSGCPTMFADPTHDPRMQR